ncbi:MAG TPA: kynureninase [Alphaproteobacteria bacterium]|nr:kynureninase [Alphaproteobacteria bacterium]
MDRLTQAAFDALDRADPLAGFRAEFQLSEDTIYLNGNSLGPLPKAAAQAVRKAAEEEWGAGLVTSWNRAGWFDLPYRLGACLAPLIGAAPDEVVLTDAAGLNLFKAAALALALNPTRKSVVMEGSNFPTNNYMVQGLISFLAQGHRIRFVEKEDILDAIDADTAATILTHVHYRTAHILDMRIITQRAKAVGALTVWDLCHSAGVLDVDLNAAGADLAVGCTYKYLNGGPGSPAFIFMARRHHGKAVQPLTGWWGHRAPFSFDRDYQPRNGVGQLLTGTQPILSLRAAEAGIDLACRADPKAVRHKAMQLGDLFIRLVEERCGDRGFALESPRLGIERGGHVAFTHPQGYPIMRALIARGVIGDFRAPTTLRFGFSPLFLRYRDVWRAVETLADIMERELWTDPAYQAAEAVT